MKSWQSPKVTRYPFCLVPVFLAVLVLFLQWNTGFAQNPNLSPPPEPPSVDVASTDTAAGIEFFEKQIRPLLIEHCYECHSQADAKGGLRLDTRLGMHTGGDRGPLFSIEAPASSLLLDAVRYQQPDLQMPPKGPLPPESIRVLEQWIAMGAPDPRVAIEPLTRPSLPIADQPELWSFHEIVPVSVPHIADGSWQKSPIDAFIQRQLEEVGLQPAPAADRRHLLRRATLDLTGLPPTLEEYTAFLEDTRPDAYERVIERLLESPAYGIRWGRHWLDVARYADSNGLDENIAFGNAWRYRDYVVEAFNRDLPWHEFVTQQLAGDLLANADTRTRTATGFLVLGAKVLAEPDREKLTMDTVDEQVDAVGKVFMGLTLGCARCHDHKFDPISQANYYGLAAIFRSTKTFGSSQFGAIKHWHEYDLSTPEVKAQIAVVESEIAAKQKLANDFRSRAMQKLRDEVRRQATDYLMAACRVSLASTLAEIAEVATPRQLHPRVLHHCRRHLEYHRDDPLIEHWHRLAKVGDEAGIEAYFRPLLQSAQEEWQAAKAKDANCRKLEDPQKEAARLLLDDPSGLLAVPAKASFAFDPATLAEFHRLSEEARLYESFAPDLPSAMGVAENETWIRLPIHLRGSHLQLGRPIERHIPESLCSKSSQPIFPRNQSGRLELAHWLTHGSPMIAARVYVNRVWGWHFGQGLVRTTENFGRLSDAPTHPDLLDWLAREFLERGGSTKELHRLLMKSATYQMASQAASPQASEVDPDNRWLSRFPMTRMDAEQIRDSLLAVTGCLDRTMDGKSVPLRNRQFVFDHTSIDHTRYESHRRSLYLPVIRNNLYSLFEQFDFPDPTMPTGHRHATTVAPQSLWMMNNELVLQSSESFANQLLETASDPRERLIHLYQQLFGRLPTPGEVEQCMEFLDTIKPLAEEARLGCESSLTSLSNETIAWMLMVQSHLCSHEFLYVR